MNHGQQQFRAFLEDGPYAGETMSIGPDDSGEPPAQVEVEGTGRVDPHGVSEHPGSAPGTPRRPATYEFDHRDLGNGVWRYRLAPDPHS